MALRTKKIAATKDEPDPKDQKQADENDPAARMGAEDKDVIDMSSLSTKKTVIEDDSSGDGGSAGIDLVDLEIDGKKVKVSKDARDALTSFLTRPAPPVAARPESEQTPKRPAANEEDDFLKGLDDKDLFIRPTEFLKDFAGRIEKRVTERVRGEYTADQGQKQFWGDFYKDNPTLVQQDSIVKSVLNEHMTELGVMPTRVASKKLAELTQARILDIVKQFGGGGKGDDNTPAVEGATGGERPGKRSVKQEDVKPTGLSGIIKQRQAARKAARQSLH